MKKAKVKKRKPARRGVPTGKTIAELVKECVEEEITQYVHGQNTAISRLEQRLVQNKAAVSDCQTRLNEIVQAAAKTSERIVESNRSLSLAMDQLRNYVDERVTPFKNKVMRKVSEWAMEQARS